MRTDTPESDKAEGCRGYDDSWIPMKGGGNVEIEFARKLELERDEARREAEKWERLYDDATDHLMTFEQSRDNYGEIERINETAIRICKERDKYKSALEQISQASGFDNIGNWAKNLARETLNPQL